MPDQPQHTPGPWRASIYCIWGGINGDTYVAGTQTAIGADAQEANARLIAAAPELLEALEAVVACWNHHDVGKAYVEDLARAAIAKAKGE